MYEVLVPIILKGLVKPPSKGLSRYFIKTPLVTQVSFNFQVQNPNRTHPILSFY